MRNRNKENVYKEKIMPYFDIEVFLKFINYIIYVVFFTIFVLLLRNLWLIFFPKVTEPTDLSGLLFEYSGLPLIFWILLGVGLMFGLTFHGFKIVEYNKKEVLVDGSKERKN